ncbi:MAG: NAD(P)H-hydrate dehydratase [Planctomycetota bacterium]|nr:NAD(P)H-hydrate dehydratase [Planctomycetota bacterium]MDA1250755.1 NAD(P)H-hydrate dehydratase [Planctomycetota bacterium]
MKNHEEAGLPVLQHRPADGHKGTFGRVLIVAGSRGMSGAAALAGTAALRGGAGLVSVALPESVQTAVASIEPGYMTIGLSETAAGGVTESAFREILPHLTGKDAIAVGPGLGNNSQVRGLVRRLFVEATSPLVVDADGLNVLAEDFRSGTLAASQGGVRILTPHPGELARLRGSSIADVERDRETAARDFAKQHRVVVVLKGPGTVVTDGDRIAVNSTGNSGMGTGGSGDVLTGLLTAVVARGGDGFESARLAVWLHGRAGDFAADELSETALIASDLPRFFGAAWQDLANRHADVSGSGDRK